MFRTNQILSPVLTLGHNTHNTTIVFDFSKLFFLDVRPNVVIVLKEKFSILFKHELCLHMDIWKTIKFQLKFITHVTIILIKKMWNCIKYCRILNDFSCIDICIGLLVFICLLHSRVGNGHVTPFYSGHFGSYFITIIRHGVKVPGSTAEDFILQFKVKAKFHPL